MVFVNDTDQPADFLTKFLKAKKLTDSLRYATNSGARANSPPAADSPSSPQPPAASSALLRPPATEPYSASSSTILPGIGSGGVLEYYRATWLSALLDDRAAPV